MKKILLKIITLAFFTLILVKVQDKADAMEPDLMNSKDDSNHAIDEKEYVSFFAHGLADTKDQIKLFLKEYNTKNGVVYNKNYILNIPGMSFDFPDSRNAIDSSVWFFELRKLIATLIRGNYDQTSFGQENEIAILQKEFSKQVVANKKIIFAGISRGASIFFTWALVHKIHNIAAAILESPYSSMADVVNFKRKQLGVEIFISESLGQAILEFLFGKYKRSGITPIDCVKCVDLNTPLLIIASRSDNLVPWESSYCLYEELKAIGHKKAHFLLLDQGEHGFLLKGPDGKKYQKIVHAFYKYYGLPCDEQLAKAGKALFAECM